MKFPMREIREEPVSRAAAERLFRAIRSALTEKHSPHDPVTCGICHEPIILENKGICADEKGQIAHTDCYVKQLIASSKPPVAPENQA
jgi:hypothetical protein